MPYEFLDLPTEDEYRKLFEETYCDPKKPIITFDDIIVKFYSDKFEHSFYESANWKKEDKSIFSIQRARRILWIKDALKDSNSDLRVGWDKKTKSYDNSRRIAIVVDKYVVIIRIGSPIEAQFVTAYWADKSITKILKSPKWKV